MLTLSSTLTTGPLQREYTAISFTPLDSFFHSCRLKLISLLPPPHLHFLVCLGHPRFPLMSTNSFYVSHSLPSDIFKVSTETPCQ